MLETAMRIARAAIALAAPLLILAVPMPARAEQEPSQGELRAAKALDDIRGDPLALYDFLKRLPKGADLHSHLHSAVFAETLIQDAIEDKLCVDVVTLSTSGRSRATARLPASRARSPPLRS